MVLYLFFEGKGEIGFFSDNDKAKGNEQGVLMMVDYL